MLSDSVISEQLKHVLTETRLDFLGQRYEGKVRDSYTSGDRRYLITTDRLSCFDRIVTSIPFKGQILNQLAAFWFSRTKDVIANHLIDIPDPNVMLVKNCEIFPLEIVVRGYLTGSAWRDYGNGKKISGIKLPVGMKNFQKFEQPILTPSTKAEQGAHDTPISEEEILEKNIVDAAKWGELKKRAMELFRIGQEYAESRGLILVDTKYEFGIYKGEIVLADEIHTLDSSRYWVKSSYEETLKSGKAPEMLDKEPTRQLLLSHGFSGEGDIPLISDEERIRISRHYMNSYELITGEVFQAECGNVLDRIERKLRS